MTIASMVAVTEFWSLVQWVSMTVGLNRNDTHTDKAKCILINLKTKQTKYSDENKQLNPESKKRTFR